MVAAGFYRKTQVQRWFRAFLQGRWFRGSNRRWWAGVIEASIAAALFLFGVVLLSVNLTLAALWWTPDGLPVATSYFVLQLLLSLVLIGLGIGWIIRLLWHVGVSAERRGAFTARTNELELLNELRKPREDLPTVPRDRLLPTAGSVLAVRITPSPRNIWGMISAATFSIIAVAVFTILLLVSAKSFEFDSHWMTQLGKLSERIAPEDFSRLPQRPWLAVGLLLVIGPAAVWSIFHFVRQLLKLTGIGPTSIELSEYPLQPGKTYEMFFSQTGRVRLNLLDVDLICQEEATYNQGTDIRTEQSVAFQSRLLRQRGVSLLSGSPYQTHLEMTIPADAMHSFKSTNNRIQWKIVVIAKAKSWPRLKRTFPISVHPVDSPRPGDLPTPRSVAIE